MGIRNKIFLTIICLLVIGAGVFLFNDYEENQFTKLNKEIKEKGLEEEYQTKQKMILDYTIKNQVLKNG